MLKITDLTASEINKQKLKAKKHKPKFIKRLITPPKNILEAIWVVNNLKTQQLSTIKNLQKSIENPDCTNSNSLNLQLKLMNEAVEKTNHTLRCIVRHLVIHQFNGITVIGRYSIPKQLNAHNLIKVSIKNDPFFVAISGKHIELKSIPYLGMHQNNTMVAPRDITSNLKPNEAIAICEAYCHQIKLAQAKTKDLNIRIRTHNKVLKTVKQRIQQGLTSLI